MSAIKQDVDTFFDHFVSLHKSILDTSFNEGAKECRAILLCSIIDTISKVVYSKNISNHNKFVFFLDDFSGWKYRDKISLIQLHYYLSGKNDLKYEPLKSDIANKYDALNTGEVINADFDNFLYELNYSKAIENEIKMFSYAELMYKFRNKVVHEFNRPGHGMEGLSSDDDVFYHSMTHYNDDMKIEEETWELVFSVRFIAKIVEQSINNVKEYCLLNSINPFNFYYFGKLWVNNK